MPITVKQWVWMVFIGDHPAKYRPVVLDLNDLSSITHLVLRMLSISSSCAVVFRERKLCVLVHTWRQGHVTSSSRYGML